jgi:hypothetical protein
MYILQPEVTKQDVSCLEADGRLYSPKHFDRRLTADRYCREKVFLPDTNMDGVYTFLCLPEKDPFEENPPHFIRYPLGLIMSSLFFLATFLAYACLPSLQNLREKTFMCHVVSLFVAYTCLGVTQTGGTILGQFFCAALVGESIQLLKHSRHFF